MSLLVGALVLLLQIALFRYVPAVGVFFYYVTLIALELLEAIGLRTLTGSPDGWPVPTNLGWAIALFGWYVIWCGLTAVMSTLMRPKTGVERPE
jgi:hypothetical protein